MSSSDNSGIALKSLFESFAHAAQDFSRGNDDEWHELREILKSLRPKRLSQLSWNLRWRSPT